MSRRQLIAENIFHKYTEYSLQPPMRRSPHEERQEGQAGIVHSMHKEASASIQVRVRDT